MSIKNKLSNNSEEWAVFCFVKSNIKPLYQNLRFKNTLNKLPVREMNGDSLNFTSCGNPAQIAQFEIKQHNK